MFKSIKKFFSKINIDRRFLVVTGMVALLVITGYLNFTLSSPADAAADQSVAADNSNDGTLTASSGNFFVDFRTTRESSREKELNNIDSVINNPNTDTSTLSQAQQMKLQLSKDMETETVLEGLIKAKGFDDAVVTLYTNSINVVVKKQQLTTEEVARILDVVKTETGQKAENIKIIPTI